MPNGRAFNLLYFHNLQKKRITLTVDPCHSIASGRVSRLWPVPGRRGPPPGPAPCTPRYSHRWGEGLASWILGTHSDNPGSFTKLEEKQVFWKLLTPNFGSFIIKTRWFDPPCGLSSSLGLHRTPSRIFSVVTVVIIQTLEKSNF